MTVDGSGCATFAVVISDDPSNIIECTPAGLFAFSPATPPSRSTSAAMPCLCGARTSRPTSIGKPAITESLPGFWHRYHMCSLKMSVFMCMPVPCRVFNLAFCEG